MEEIKLTESQAEEFLRSIIGDDLVDSIIKQIDSQDSTAALERELKELEELDSLIDAELSKRKEQESEDVCEDCGFSTCICDQLEEETEISLTDKFEAYIHNFMGEVLSGKIVLENCQEQLALQHVIRTMESNVSA